MLHEIDMLASFFNNMKSCFCLVGVLILIYLAKISLASFGMRLDVYREFGLSLSGWMGGKAWTLITYAFIHEGWLHLCTNILFLLLIGRLVEQRLGKVLLWRIIMMGILGGGVIHLLASVWLVFHGGIEPVLIGISGGCYALLLALMTLMGNSYVGRIPVSAKNITTGVILSQLLLLLMSPAFHLPVFSQVGEWIVSVGLGDLFRSSFSCHLGGGLAGWRIARRHMIAKSH